MVGMGKGSLCCVEVEAFYRVGFDPSIFEKSFHAWCSVMPVEVALEQYSCRMGMWLSMRVGFC